MIRRKTVENPDRPGAPRAPEPPVPGAADNRLFVALLVLSALIFVAHLSALPTTFADLDAINFALGVRDFDVARHQPHPPGYPVFVAAAKASTALVAAAGVTAPEVRGLSVLSAMGGAVLLPLLFLFFRRLTNDPTTAAWAAVVAVASPLVWFNALRPLSDLAGLAVVVLAQVLLAPVILGPARNGASRALILGAFVSGLAIGTRSQNFVLTLPLLATALMVSGERLTLRDRAAAVGALVVGGLCWGIPLLAASGGLEAYLRALRDQAGEDFSGVVMLWTTPSPRVAIDAIAHSFLWPWGTLAAGWVVIAIAVAGGVRMMRKAPRALLLLIVGFGPYALFHLLFQETVTTRYALPLVIPIALLVAFAFAGAGRLLLHGGCAVVVAWSLAVTLSPVRLYAQRPAPAVRALSDALAAADGTAGVAMHAVMRRTEQWYHDNASGRVVRAPHGREIPALVEEWRRAPDMRVSFIADPRRSDLAMLDPRARSLAKRFNWGFRELPFVGGVRPGETLLYSLRPPGWMLGTGWAVTAEVGGQTARARAEPHRQPATAWVRARSEATTFVIGGRNLHPSGGAAAVISVSVDGQVFDSFQIEPGFFLETRSLPAATLERNAGSYVPVQIAATAARSSEVRVSLEQFDLQSAGVPMFGYAAGWHEPEYNAARGGAWRWMSNRAMVWVRPIGRDVTLTLSAESPLRYFDEPPVVRISAGGQLIAQFSPAADFTQEVKIPMHLLAAGNDHVVIESNKVFVPGNGDARPLALRVYAVEVN